MSEWREVSLGEVADLLVGFAFKSVGFVDERSGNPRLLRGVNIGQGALDWSRSAHWPRTQRAAYERYELAEGDVVLAMDRPWIEAGLKRARICARDLPALLVQRVTRLRGTEAVRTSYLHHVIASGAFSDYIKPIVTGVTVPHISPDQIKAFRFRLPPLSQQDAICRVLDAIDDLIENNRRRIALLELMAQAIYREWFVHFRYPGHENDELVDSPLGPLPTGWGQLRFGDLVQLYYGKALKADARCGGEVAVVGSSGIVGWHDEALIGGPAIIVGRKGNVGSVMWIPMGCWPIDTTYWVGTDLPLHFAYEMLRQVEFIDSHAAVPGLSRDQAYAIELIRPPTHLMHEFDGVASKLNDLAELLEKQTGVLKAARDELLPRLVTGAIDVSHLDLDALLAEDAA